MMVPVLSTSVDYFTATAVTERKPVCPTENPRLSQENLRNVSATAVLVRWRY